MNSSFQICYFGILAERRGHTEERLSHPAATAAELYSALDGIHRLGLKTGDFRVAVNDEFVPWDHPITNGDRIAFLPPMSGG